MWGVDVGVFFCYEVGKNSSFIQVPFLNLMMNLQERAGLVLIRLGGNTQEYATMVDSLDNGKAIMKQQASNTQTVRCSLLFSTFSLTYRIIWVDVDSCGFIHH